MRYYIKERYNPQFRNPYYVALGQLSKRDANKNKKAVYGKNAVLGFDTEEEYNKHLQKLKDDGFSVH